MNPNLKQWLLMASACLVAVSLAFGAQWYMGKSKAKQQNTQTTPYVWVWDGCRWRLAREEE